MSAERAIVVGDVAVRGALVDAQTRCVHYSGPLDMVAIRFACCGEWFPCLHCHDEVASHPRQAWRPEDGGVHAVLCGVCARTMSIDRYRVSAACPVCAAAFNPGCAVHHPLYFG